METTKKIQDKIIFCNYSVWIDVSKKTLDVCILREDLKFKEEFKILNDNTWIKELESRIKKIKDLDLSNKKSFFFCMESTWSYHIYPAITLREKWYTVKVFNPIISSKYSKSSVRKIKTDKVDARRIAEIWFKEELFDFEETKESYTLKKKISLITKLQKERQTLSQSINQSKEDFKKLWIKSKDNFKELDKTIDQFDKTIKSVQKEIIELWKNIPWFDKVSEIKWLWDLWVCILLTIIQFKTFNSKQSLNAFAWLDIWIRQSWTSINYKWRISKRWNAILRKVLAQMAWWLKMHNEYFKPLIEYHQGKWRHYFEILVILARKILYIIYWMLKTDTHFDSAKIWKFC